MRGRALVLLLCVPVAAAGCRNQAAPQPPAAARSNIVLVTVDTWRADRLGAGISPALDRLAASGIRFTAARTAAPLTLPAHATVLTGLLPPAHGVRVNGLDRLSDAHPTVARLLKNAGYRTAAFVGAFVLDRRFGLAQGFDTYDDQIPRDPRAAERLDAERPASAVVDRAIAWLDQNLSATPPASPAPPALPALPAPFFIWVHVYDPHAPYSPPPEFIDRVERLGTGGETKEQVAYDGEIAYADAQLARLFDRLQTLPRSDRTIIIVAGDHGEGLGEHGERTHGMLLYDSTLRVPLVIVAPGHRSESHDEAVSLVDVAPTILAAAGVGRLETMAGRDLLKEAGRGEAGQKRDLYGETEYPRAAGWSPLRALTDGRWLTITAGDATELYDLQNDPQERHNGAGGSPSIAHAMRARIETIAAAAKQMPPSTMNRETGERLRALGYVATGAQSAAPPDAPNPADRIDAWNQFEQGLDALNRQRPDSLRLLERLAREHPESPVFQATAARALKEAGKLNQALDAYRTAVRRWPSDATLYHDLAVAARDAADTSAAPAARALREEAARAERAALTLAPDSALAHNGLGLLAIDQGQPQAAVAEFERASTLDPTNASYLANLGNARRAAGDRAGAEQAYRQAMAISDRAADAANGLGVLLVESQRPAEAVPWFERALASAPGFVEARLNLGIALQESGQPARAVEQYRQVLSARGAAREKQAAAKLLASLGTGRSR